MRELPRETRHERGVRGCSAGIERCSRGRCSSQKRSVARRGPQSEEAGMRRAAIVQFFVETTGSSKPLARRVDPVSRIVLEGSLPLP